METFCDWIDQYKCMVDWGFLFEQQSLDDGKTFETYKFHQIPFEMQVGVILRFVNEHQFEEYQPDTSRYYEYDITDLTISEAMMNWFASFIQQYDEQINPNYAVTNPPGDDDDLPF